MEARSIFLKVKEHDLINCKLYEAMYVVYLSLTFSTFRKSCPAQIRLRASKDGNSLVVAAINTDHNHDLSKVLVLICIKLLSKLLQTAFSHVPNKEDYIKLKGKQWEKC